jgi:cell division protein FtsL
MARRTKEQRLERRREHRAASDVAVTVMASVSIALPLLFYLHQHVEMLRTGYEIDTLKQRRELLVERQRQLRVERARRADLARIEEAAGKLGLRAPEPQDVQGVKGRSPRAAVRGAGRGGAGLD